MSDKKPYEIARETLRQLTTRKLVPTPANYQAIYNDIAGLPNVLAFPEDTFRQIVQLLPARNPGQEKQKGLMEFALGRRNWKSLEDALMTYEAFDQVSVTAAEPAMPVAPPPVVVAAAAAPALTPEFMAQLARLIEHALPALETDDTRFLEQTEQLLQLMRDPAGDVLSIKAMLANLGHRISFVAEEQAEIKKTLLKLLHLIVDNIGQLGMDEGWLKGQTDALKEAATPPLTLRRLDDVERRLKEVLFKQAEARGRAEEAQAELRRMLAAFLERLSRVTEASGTLQRKMEDSVRQIEQARTLEEIAPVLREVIGATRDMAGESSRVNEELTAMRSKTEAAEAELVRLHRELDRVSAQARHDALTGALNRQGLEEALNREVSVMRRRESPFCVALLDIDNFKRLNDSKGHATGDAALAHLATVARECLRPQDSLARYGGEEFVILMPDTLLEQGIQAMTRVQRELTKRFFLAGNEKILITFSAGVAQLAVSESGAEAIRRADHAMYLAKRAGKNRVLGA